MSTMNCPNCNTTSPAGAIFCDNCGYDLRNAIPAQPQTPPTVATPSADPIGIQDSGGVICQECGHSNIEGSAFCENCGTRLTQVQQQIDAQPAAPASPPPTPIPGPDPYPTPSPTPAQPPVSRMTARLVIQGANINLPVPPNQQEVVIGREDPVSNVFPEINLDPHGGQDAGVGRTHAKLTLINNQAYIEDLNSVNGTWVNKQRIPSNNPIPINNGDEIRLGLLTMIYYTN